MKPFRIADCGLRIGAAAICIVALALGLLAVPLAAEAQQAGRVYRIGVLSAERPLNLRGGDMRLPLFLKLRELGWLEGQNLVIEERYAAGNLQRFPELAMELVSARVDVIVACGRSQLPTVPASLGADG